MDFAHVSTVIPSDATIRGMADGRPIRCEDRIGYRPLAGIRRQIEYKGTAFLAQRFERQSLRTIQSVKHDGN